MPSYVYCRASGRSKITATPWCRGRRAASTARAVARGSSLLASVWPPTVLVSAPLLTMSTMSSASSEAVGAAW